MIDMLRSTDTNRDGRIEISEVPEYRQGMVRGIFQRYGIDASQPVSFDQIRQKMSGGGQPGGGPPPQPQSSRTQASTVTDPLVLGFGVAQEARAVHPFGARVEDPSVASYYGGGASETDDRTMQYARGAIQRYDRNHNGVIDRDETEGMRSDPREIDRNHDGRITLDEMVHRVQQYQGGRGGDNNGDRGGDNEEERYAGVRYQPFRTIDAIIPEGTPEWFIRLDKNRDGNVSMLEYSTAWTDALALEFEWWDVNQDGVITPEECIEATKENEEREDRFEHPDPPPLEGEEEGRGEQEESRDDVASSGEGESEREDSGSAPAPPEFEQPRVVVVHQDGGQEGAITVTRQEGQGSGAMTVQMHAVPNGGRPPEPSRDEGSREGYSRGDGGGDSGRGRGGSYGRR
jgi:Ca2+-binding EF-hand superfamily protein